MLHAGELQHLPLPDDAVKRIEELTAAGVPYDEVSAQLLVFPVDRHERGAALGKLGDLARFEAEFLQRLKDVVGIRAAPRAADQAVDDLVHQAGQHGDTGHAAVGLGSLLNELYLAGLVGRKPQILTPLHPWA